MSSILDYFWNLASLDASERFKAASDLIEALTKEQKSFSEVTVLDSLSTIDTKTRQDSEKPVESDGEEESENEEDEFDKLFASDVSYSVKRLCKGLASGRQGARQGFAMALAELIRTIMIPMMTASKSSEASADNVKLSQALILFIKKVTDLRAGMKGYEERDCIYGRIFGYAAMQRGGMLSGEGSLEEIKAVLSELWQFAAQKPYLREVCFEVITSIIQNLNNSDLTKAIFEFICQDLVGGDPIWSIELFGLINLMSSMDDCSCMPSEIGARLKLDGRGMIISEDNMELLKDLVNSSTEFSHPRVNSALERLVSDLLQTESSFKQFWFSCVEGKLMDGGLEKKYLALRLFQIAFNRCQSITKTDNTEDYSIMISLFGGGSQRVLKCWMKSLDNPQLALCKLARKISDDFLKAASTSDGLLYIPGVKTGLVSASAGNVSGSASSKFIQKLLQQQQQNDSETAEKTAATTEFDREKLLGMCQKLIEEYSPESGAQLTVDQLLHLADQSVKAAATDNDECVECVLKFLINLSYNSTASHIPVDADASVDQKSKKNIISQYALNKLWSFVSNLCKQRSNEKSLSSLKWLQKLLSLINNSEDEFKEAAANGKKDGKEDNFLIAYLQLAEMHERKFPSAAKSAESAEEMEIVENEEEEESAAEMLKDAKEAIKNLIKFQKKQQKKKQSKKQQESTLADDLNPVDVLTDLLVSLLSKSCAEGQQQQQSFFNLSTRLCKQVVSVTFKTFCCGSEGVKLSVDGVKSILRVFDPIYDALEGGSEESEEQDAVVKVTVDGDDNNAEEADALTIQRIKEALGQAALSMEEDADNLSSDDLDDEQMMALGFDQKLCEVFKERKLEKDENAGMMRFLVEFRHKCLDLLQIMISNSNSSSSSNSQLSSLILTEVIPSLLRSAAVYSNPASALSSVAAHREVAAFDDLESLLTQISFIGKIDLLQRQPLIDKMLKLTKQAATSTNNDQQGGDSYVAALKQVESLLLGGPSDSVTWPESIKLFPTPTKEVVSCACKVISAFIKNLFAQDQQQGKCQTILERYLKSAMTGKGGKGSIPFSLFSLLIEDFRKEKSAGSLWPLFMRDVIEGLSVAKTATSTFAKSQIWHLIVTFCHSWKPNTQVAAGGDEIDEVSRRVFDVALIQINLVADSGAGKMKVGKVKEIVQQVCTVVKRLLSIESVKVDAKVAVELIAAVDKIMAVEEFSSNMGVKQVCQNMKKSLSTSSPSVPEVKQEEITEVVPVAIAEIAPVKEDAPKEKTKKRKNVVDKDESNRKKKKMTLKQ